MAIHLLANGIYFQWIILFKQFTTCKKKNDNIYLKWKELEIMWNIILRSFKNTLQSFRI